MKERSQRSEVRGQWLALAACVMALVCGAVTGAAADDFAALCADRAAIERVYYQHRLGDKLPFAEALPRETLERLVRDDLRKEAALKKVFGDEVTAAMLEAEVRRINSTTRAPEILAELQAALGNDPVRFTRTVARPIVVERLLRERFDNDDKLHASQRREIERIREQLIKTSTDFRSSRVNEAHSSKSEIGNRKPEIDVRLLTSAATHDLLEKLLALLEQSHSNDVTETTWQLGARPEEKPGAENPDEVEIRKRFGPNAQILSSPHVGGKEQKFYFEDLPGELQKVLRVQLRQAGDVSAVIEMPGGFLLYVCKEKTPETLAVAAFSLPKRSYEQWLAEQEGETR